MRKNDNYDKETKQKVYGEIFKLATSPKLLVGGDLKVEFIKEKHFGEVNASLKSQHKEFGRT
jgi:hypothetical protein